MVHTQKPKKYPRLEFLLNYSANLFESNSEYLNLFNRRFMEYRNYESLFFMNFWTNQQLGSAHNRSSYKLSWKIEILSRFKWTNSILKKILISKTNLGSNFKFPWDIQFFILKNCISRPILLQSIHYLKKTLLKCLNYCKLPLLWFLSAPSWAVYLCGNFFHNLPKN